MWDERRWHPPEEGKWTLKAKIIDIAADNVAENGFFCYMSKKKSEGYQRKLAWLQARFAEGLRIKMLAPPERGFIEYIPGEHAWRGIHADGYMVIHCLWVVGASKGKGFAKQLIQECIADAKRSKKKGVVMLTSEKVWLASKRIFLDQGFACVDQALPAFSLMVKKFGAQDSPRFAGDFAEKAKACGPGLTIFRSSQCPYIVDATSLVLATALKAGGAARTVELTSRDEVLRLSPSPYGVFSIVLDGKLLSYHYLLEKDLAPHLKG